MVIRKDYFEELRKHTVGFHEAQKKLISTNPTLFQSELENLTDSCMWIRLPIPGKNAKTVPNMIHVGVESLPNTCLAGILLEILENRVPKGMDLSGLCIDNNQNNLRFCISGSVSLEELRTLCEQHP